VSSPLLTPSLLVKLVRHFESLGHDGIEGSGLSTAQGNAACAAAAVKKNEEVVSGISAGDGGSTGGLHSWRGHGSHTSLFQKMMEASKFIKDCVTVCTVHAAKGKEWDHVCFVRVVQGGSYGCPIQTKDRSSICAGGHEGCPLRPEKGEEIPNPAATATTPTPIQPIPIPRSGNVREKRGEATLSILKAALQLGSQQICLEEERRVFFVGISRARKSLTICYHRKDRKREEEFFRSVFVRDLEQACASSLAAASVSPSSAAGGVAPSPPPPPSSLILRTKICAPWQGVTPSLQGGDNEFSPSQNTMLGNSPSRASSAIV